MMMFVKAQLKVQFFVICQRCQNNLIYIKILINKAI